jgi:hypothetical protein
MSIWKYISAISRFTLVAITLLGTFLGVLTGTAVAQTSYGAIVGTVTDSTGANLDGAQVVLKNNGTNATLTTKAGSGGTYSFLNLNPGSYTVTITNPGFKANTRKDVEVTVGGTSRVDAAMEIGELNQTVTVEATAAPLQTDSASLGGVVSGRQVLESPLNGRNVNNLLDFVPGVVPGGGTSGNTFANGGSGSFQAGAQTQAIAYGNYQIGGGFSGQSLFFIDGVGSNVPENNVNSIVPTQDAVQEFRVQTNNVSAEFGGFAGGVIQISTKSGTNDIHGSVYEYFRNTVLDANDWFSNHQGLQRPPLHQNQYGANIGLPIIKNKLFAFFSYERETLTSGSISTYTLPTAAQLAGDFSATGTNIYNPTTGVQYSCNGQLNVICPSQIDPTAAKILALEAPLPNRPGLVNNYVATAPIEGAQNQYNARVDYNLGSTDQLFARYTFWNPHNGNSDPLGTKVGSGPTGNTTTEAVVGDNHIFNPTTIADLRLSWLENYNYQTPLSNGFDQSTINANYAALQAQQVNHNQGLLPNVGIPGYSLGVNLSQLYWLNTVYAISGSVTKVAGRHTIKVGGLGRQILWTNFGNNQGVGSGATAAFTASPSNPSSGNALASYLLGVPASSGITEVGTWRAVLHSYGFYATDTWQATNKLTANLGVRWDQPGSYSEVNDLDTVLQPNLATTLGSITNPVTGTSSPIVGGLVYVNSAQYPSRREETQHWKLFSPRIGMNYRVNDSTVVRGGYGVSYLPAEITADSPGAAPINNASTGLSNTPGGPVNTTIANPFPNGILLPSGRTAAALQAVLGQGIGSRIPNQPYGYVQQWNFGVEQAFGSKTSMTVSYAGAKGTHLTLSQGFTGTGLNLNQLPDQYNSIGGSAGLGTGLFKPVANPLYGKIPAGGQLGGPTILEGYLLKPYPQYTSVNQTVPRFGSSTYEALQATFNRRFSHSGLVQVAYTWGKLLSNTENTSSFQDGQGGQGVVQDNYNLQAEKSISMQDLTNNLVINYGVDLPFGRGERFLGNTNTVVNAVVGGWRVNGITTFHSGLPLPFSTSGNSLSNYFGSGPIRPNVVPGCAKNPGGSAQSRVNSWFNKSCFTIPADFTFGNERRVDSGIRSAGAANFDFSANKSFPIFERLTGKFSLETFNLFNRAQFAAPDTNLNDGGYATVTRQANQPRTLQAALRLSF